MASTGTRYYRQYWQRARRKPTTIASGTNHLVQIGANDDPVLIAVPALLLVDDQGLVNRVGLLQFASLGGGSFRLQGDARTAVGRVRSGPGTHALDLFQVGVELI